MPLSTADIDAIALSLRLAAVTCVLLLLLGTPLAWWLANRRTWYTRAVAALVTLPLVLPPTVLGFYLLLLLGPDGWVGQLTQALDVGPLTFSFTALVIGSMISSLPFVLQPLYSAFSALGQDPLEAAATLRASPLDRFLTVVLPQTRGAFLTAVLLCSAHTLGEFGVVLMIGGNIPGQTQVVSVQIYNHVEALNYPQAHALAAGLVVLAFIALLSLSAFNRTQGARS